MSINERLEKRENDDVDTPLIAGIIIGTEVDIGQDLGVSHQYERKVYDSQKARMEFHDSQFGDKKTITSPTGEILHRSQEAAKRKYGEAHASDHQAQADHKDPIKNIHKRHKNDIFLTDDDIKDVANRQRNFQELSRHENASKGAKSEKARGMETGDIKRVISGVETEFETEVLLAGKKLQNAAGVAYEGGKATALVTLTVSGIQNLSQVAAGEKDLQAALSDVAKDTATSFVSGAGAALAQQTIAGVARNIGAEHITEAILRDFPSAEVAVAVMTVKSVKKYLNGEISGEDCAIQILANGVGTLAYQIGMAAGGPAGAIVASIVTTQITNTILAYRREKKIQKERDAEINCVLTNAKAETLRQREMLQRYFRDELDRWNSQISKGFDLIDRSSQAGDSNGVAEGLDIILSLIDSQVRFKTSGEFKKAFFNPNAAPIVM